MEELKAYFSLCEYLKDDANEIASTLSKQGICIENIHDFTWTSELLAQSNFSHWTELKRIVLVDYLGKKIDPINYLENIFVKQNLNDEQLIKQCLISVPQTRNLLLYQGLNPSNKLLEILKNDFNIEGTWNSKQITTCYQIKKYLLTSNFFPQCICIYLSGVDWSREDLHYIQFIDNEFSLLCHKPDIVLITPSHRNLTYNQYNCMINQQPVSIALEARWNETLQVINERKWICYPRISIDHFTNHFCENNFSLSLPKPSIKLLSNGKIDNKLNVIFNHPFREGEIVNQVIVKNIFSSANAPKLLELLPSRDNVIFKVGDNLLNDQICLSYMRVFNEIWKELNIQVHVKIGDRVLSQVISAPCYSISVLLPHSSTRGFISYVDGESLIQLWDRNSFIRKAQSKWNDLENRLGNDSIVNLLATAVGSFVSGFVLALGDRHQENMMVDTLLQFINIDFGFSFGETTLPDTSDFPIPIVLWELLERNNLISEFYSASWTAIQALSSYKNHFISLSSAIGLSPYHVENIHKNFNKTLSVEKGDYFMKISSGRFKKLPKDITHYLGSIKWFDNLKSWLLGSPQS